jgi:hypothetical protein
MVELNMGILCASSPATKALFSKTQRGRTQDGTYQYHSRERSVMKGYGKDRNKNSSVGTVIPIESYRLKDVESERPDTRKPKEREERDGGGAWRVPDSDVPDGRVVWPESRV